MLYLHHRHHGGKRLAASDELGPRACQRPRAPRRKRLVYVGRSIAIAVLAATPIACGANAGKNQQSHHHSHPSPSTKHGAGISAQSTGGASPGSVPIVNRDLPVLIDSAAYQQAADGGFTYAFSRTLTSQQVAKLNDLPVSFQSYITQVTSLDGTNIYDTNVQIVLQGNAVGQTAVVSGMNVIKKCQQPLTGTLLYSPAAAQDNNIEIGFNLDNRFPIAQDYQGGRLSGNYFDEHTISLKHGETQTLFVHAVTRQYFCQFTYQLLVDTGGRQVAEQISDSGKPFTVTAGLKARSYHALYLGGVASPAGNDKYVSVDPKGNNPAIQAYNQSVAASL